MEDRYLGIDCFTFYFRNASTTASSKIRKRLGSVRDGIQPQGTQILEENRLYTSEPRCRICLLP